jgi:uncharacterized protein YndB with AHSA1/START domain
MSDGKLDLEIVRVLAAPRAKIWRAWSDPNILKEWWCPKPWVTEVRAFDFRAGGAFHTIMTGPKPEDEVSDNPGIFLEIVPLQRIVWTSMLVEGWRPGTPWLAMTGIFILEDDPAGTRYTARCLHKDDADRAQHEKMGFFEGWGIMVQQMEDVARGL